MNHKRLLSLALDPGLLMRAQGLTPDPWQQQFLLSTERLVLLNCSRQSGKSSVVAALALHTAIFHRDSLVLLFSPSQRQSHELFRKVLEAYNAIGRPIPTVQDAHTLSKLELHNGSRIIGLPGKEATIRGFSRPRLVLLDEAARIPDALYRTVRPMSPSARAGSSLCRRRSVSAAGSGRSGKPIPSSARFRCPGDSARASRRSSSSPNAGPWVTPGSARSTKVASTP